MWMTSNRREVFSLDPIAFTRILLSLVMLGYASWVDLKTREIYDLVWMFRSLKEAEVDETDDGRVVRE